MRIIAFSDIHGNYRSVESLLRDIQPYDVVVIAGDLTTYGTNREAEEAVRGFQTCGKPLMIVAGNMDPPLLEETFSQLGVSINGRGKVLEDVGFFGVSASPFSPLHTPYEISEAEIRLRAAAGYKAVEGARWKIFVPHAPPANTRLDVVRSGRHVGSIAVREFIERHQPDVAICGHIHEAGGVDAIGKTTIINCGPAAQGYYGAIEVTEKVTVQYLRASVE
jgi:uncharacterized protein